VGAEVSVPNTNIRTFVADDGTFRLGIPTEAAQILIRRIGYKRYLITVPAGQNAVDAQLERDILQLEEVVVTGVATGIERRNLANAVATVSSDDVGRVPAASVEQAIAGKVAGADIQSNSGAPGGGIQVRLRGVTSINADAQPIYVVDGIILSDVAIPSNINDVTDATGGSNPALTQDNQVNRIADLNPNDIQSIEILKGASASAIYGSKASNGVIIIRTKRGRVGRPQINFSQQLGFRDLANTLTHEFGDATEVDQAFGAGTAAQYNFDPNRSWEQDLAGSNPLSFESSLGISGGNEDTQYFVSGLYRDEEGIMPNTGFDKQALRLNLDQALGDRLQVQVSTNLIRTLARRGISNNDNTGTSPWFAGASTPRFLDLNRQADGTFPDNPFERSNPIQTVSLLQNDEEVWRLIGSVRVEFDAVRSAQHYLRLIGSAGADRFSQKNELLFPPELQFEDDDGLPGTSLLSNTDNENLNLSGNIVYTYAPGSGLSATTSAGVQFDTRDLNTSRVTTRNLLSGQSNITQGSVVAVDENRQRVEDLGFYVQEELLINDRLLLTAGVRADQTSSNTRDDKLFFYPKAAASYRFDFERGIFDGLKFRAAYGESGNQPFFGQKFSPLDGTTNIESILGFQVPPGGGLLGSKVVVSDIQPERQREFEVGLDASLADGRGSVEATFYTRRVSDLLLDRQLAPSTGFIQETFNGGKLRVNGVEAAISIVPIQTAEVNWVFRSTFNLNRSKVTELPVPSFFPNNAGFGPNFGNFRIEEGKSATQLAGNLPCDEFPGTEGCVAGGTFIGQVGEANPDFRASFTNDISWKNLNLFFLWDWQQGGDIVNLTRLLFDAGSNSKDCTYTGDPATDPCIARLSTFSTDLRVYIEEGTYLKLREITLSYDLPQSTVSALWGALRSARLKASARNWITITDYTGMDPEVSNFGNQAVGRNIDVAPYPRTRSFWFGFELGF
jgi:TonB-linked SusC/RagA family outer membrane protein